MSHNKIIAALVMAFAANSAMAYTGTINFEGEIIAGSCTVTAANGGAGSGQNIKVGLGQISKDDLANAGQVATSAPFTLNLTCADMEDQKKVTMAFDAGNGSGTDAKNINLLKAEGVAKGVGIGVFDKNNVLLNLSANPTITEDLAVNAQDGTGTATLQLRAGFVANGDAVVVGTAEGRLPFTLSYE